MESGEVIAGRYEIVKLWATGGMAVVYRARDTTTGDAVALKVLRSGAGAAELARFAREAETLAALAHPAIVRILDRGTTGSGESYIVQEWVEGMTLRERMRFARLSMREAVAIVRSIAVALGEAHGRGVVHRDVKPSNVILVGDAGAVKVLDFGVARIVSGPVRKLTRTGAVVGTLNYMAPEQARGAGDVDARADVFALGAVLYEGIVGHEAFRGVNALSTRAKIIALAPRPIADVVDGVPAPLAALIERMLAKTPADRPADAAEVVAALDAAGEVPDRPAVVRPAALEPGEAARFTCVVMSAPARELLGVTADELRADVDAVATAFGCDGAVMDDGSALITAPPAGAPPARAAATTRAALALKRKWDVVPVAVAGGLDTRSAERSIDDRSAVVHAETVTAVFTDYADDADDAGAPPNRGVLIEADVAALIEDGFEITGERGALRVVAERRGA